MPLTAENMRDDPRSLSFPVINGQLIQLVSVIFAVIPGAEDMLGSAVVKVDYDLLIYPMFPSGHGRGFLYL